MARLFPKRMTLVLALIASLLIGPQFSVPAHAVLYGGDTGAGEDPGGGSGTPQKGDPDLPTGPSRTVRTTQSGGMGSTVAGPAGDGSLTGVNWVWRLRIVLRSLQAYYLHF
jgi:hypothetical protein